jgi:hypothetical protein
MMVGRWDFMLAPVRQGLVSLDGMERQLAQDRARDQPLDPAGALGFSASSALPSSLRLIETNFGPLK